VRNKRLFEFLRKHSLLEKVGNVFYAERAFRINAIFKWFDKHKNKLSRKKMASLMKDYLKNEIDIVVKDDKLTIVRQKELT